MQKDAGSGARSNSSIAALGLTRSLLKNSVLMRSHEKTAPQLSIQSLSVGKAGRQLPISSTRAQSRLRDSKESIAQLIFGATKLLGSVRTNFLDKVFHTLRPQPSVIERPTILCL
ncbi:MAG TPA: hypothetical protein V6D50_20625 [Chroococcales cyanobacterium]